VQADQDKAQALQELMQHDLPAKLVDYKRQLQELRSVLGAKEKEKEQFLQNFEVGASDLFAKALLEKQAAEMLNLHKAVEEFERRHQQCERKWADLLKENQLNQEHALTYKEQLERQRETYNRLLTMTERRVIQANAAIALACAAESEERRQAAEFLSDQIYQLYEERRQVLLEKDGLQAQNTELQRLNVGLRVELEKYRAFVGEDFSTHQLVQRVDELQDLLIQQRQMTDVSIIVEAHAQIRSLNVELAKKTKLIEDLKTKVQVFNSKKNAKDLRQDEDLVEYLVSMVKERENSIEELQFKIAQLLVI